MLRFSWVLVLGFLFATGLGSAMAAEDYGTPAEAKAMLEKAVAAVKQDKSKALEMFTKGEGGFKEKDLYPFCAGPDGNFTAHPKLVGKSLADLEDKSGKKFGQEILDTAQEGEDLRSQLHVPAAWRHRPGTKGCLRDQGRRPSLRRRLLQVRLALRLDARITKTKPALPANPGGRRLVQPRFGGAFS